MLVKGSEPVCRVGYVIDRGGVPQQSQKVGLGNVSATQNPPKAGRLSSKCKVYSVVLIVWSSCGSILQENVNSLSSTTNLH